MDLCSGLFSLLPASPFLPSPLFSLVSCHARCVCDKSKGGDNRKKSAGRSDQSQTNHEKYDSAVSAFPMDALHATPSPLVFALLLRLLPSSLRFHFKHALYNLFFRCSIGLRLSLRQCEA